MIWEANFLYWIQETIRQDWLNPILIALTSLGNHGWFWIATILFCLICRKYRKTGVYAMISCILTYVFVIVLLKLVVNRTRPYDAYSFIQILVPKEHDASFPSGHSAISFSVAMIYYYCLSNKKVGIGFVVLAALIALSRLYVGVHYPTDVIGGIFFGCLMSYGVKYFLIDKEKRAS